MKNKIRVYLHCGKCLEEKPEGISPRDYANNEVGWTVKGFQIWCKRHEMNVANFDLKGNKVGVIEE